VVQSQKTAQEDHSNHNHSHDDHSEDDDSHDSHKMVSNERTKSPKELHIMMLITLAAICSLIQNWNWLRS
jgi:hypothetical protein